jgi:hypothetical protein
MEMNRSIVKRLAIHGDIDDWYVEAEKSELLSMVWEITKDAWSFVKGEDAERRLQRDVEVFIRKDLGDGNK